jgi:hypothetical protein
MGLRRSRAVVAAALAVAAVTSAVVAGYAWKQPASVIAVTNFPYTQRSELTYTAVAPPSVYERGYAGTGDPVFLRTSSDVEITATYDFAADAEPSVRGSIGLRAEVRDGSGWHRSFDLGAPVRFNGTHAVRTAPLNLERLQGVLADVRAETGTSSGSYFVDVVSDITIRGSVGGQPLVDTFTPRIEFQLDELRLSPRTQAASSEAPYTTTVNDHLDTSRRLPNRVDLAWLTMPIGTLRAIGVAGCVVAALATALAAVAAHRRLPDEAARIALRHRRRLVPVRAAELRSGVTVLEVASIGDLVRLADQHGMLILHERAPGADTYYFQVDRTAYRYISGIDRTVHRQVSGCDGPAHTSASRPE